MKNALFFLACLASFQFNAQVINQSVNSPVYFNQANYTSGCGIMATEYEVGITVQTVYRARPDGYHVVFTTSFIGRDVEDVEIKMNKKIDSLIAAVQTLKIERRDVLAEVLSLDPIFAFDLNSVASASPIGYKVSENITFHTRDFQTIRYLSKICLDFKIYDIVHITPYVRNADRIYDTLADKSVEILNFKKELSKKIGHGFSNGKANFTKCKNVIYPSDSYLRSQLRNSRLYMHSPDQNSDVDLMRNVQVDTYEALNLKNADYVFNPEILEPAIQFYYRINYNYINPPEKPEKKEGEEETHEAERVFYILDNKGELRKVEFD